MRTMSNSTWLPQNVVLWAACRNDSRYLQLLTNNEKGDEVCFDRFPAPKRWKASAEKRKRWIVACRCGDSFVIVCGKTAIFAVYISLTRMDL